MMQDISKDGKTSAQLHENVPPNWYYQSIKENLFQRYWHLKRFEEVGKLIEPVDIILDIGCADGVFTKVILDKSAAKKIIGIDVLKTSVDWASKHWKKQTEMEFLVGDAHKLEFKTQTFDAVLALEVLEHVFDPEAVLREIERVLKREGYAILLVPTDSKLFNIIWYIWTKLRGKIWRGTHTQTYRNNYLPKLARKLGFTIENDKKFLWGMLHLLKVRKG